MVTRPTRAATKTAPAKTAIKADKSHKQKATEKKVKVVRDSFTMPQDDYDLIATLKKKVSANGLHVKKSELLRAGLRLLAKSSLVQLKKAVSDLEKIKTGRPKKD